MGRPKKFSRSEVLEKALPLFWEKGFSSTCLQELEKATGVNKSGLYSEFEDKNEIFMESLKYYLSIYDVKTHLLKEPLGWNNIKSFFTHSSQSKECHPRGCFLVNSLRELSSLPDEARELIQKNRERLREAFISNLKAEKVKNAPAVADFIITFVSGLAIEENLNSDPQVTQKKISAFFEILTSHE